MLLQHLEALFGQEAAKVVDVVTHLGSIYKVKLSEEENLQILERTDNKQGLYVKLADRMHNVRTIHGHKDLAKRKRIAQETLAFYVPLAGQLGLKEEAAELKERSIEVINKAAEPHSGKELTRQ